MQPSPGTKMLYCRNFHNTLNPLDNYTLTFVNFNGDGADSYAFIDDVSNS